jgi:hypothetical protein
MCLSCREGADFVRGYPFSLREGVPTAISHGLWLNIPDYDAPTQVRQEVQQQQHWCKELTWRSSSSIGARSRRGNSTQ